MSEKAKSGDLKVVNGAKESDSKPSKRRRWDQAAEDTPTEKKKKSSSSWEAVESATPSQNRWDETPGRAKGSETPGATPGASTRMWETTPGHATPGAVTPGRGDTPGHATPGHQGTPSARRNRWDETPRTERGGYHEIYQQFKLNENKHVD
jgi:splicing factor 3B subunit 1